MKSLYQYILKEFQSTSVQMGYSNSPPEFYNSGSTSSGSVKV